MHGRGCSGVVLHTEGEGAQGAPPVGMGRVVRVTPELMTGSNRLPGVVPGSLEQGEVGQASGAMNPGMVEMGNGLSLLAGTPRYKHDRNIPWEVEARAWEALDAG